MRELLVVCVTVGVLCAVSSGPAHAAEFDVCPESGLAYTVLHRGEVYLRLGVTAWGPSWSWFGFGGPDGTEDGRHVFSSTATIGGTQNRITVSHAAQAAESGGVAFDYAFTAPQQSALTQIVASVQPGAAAFAGGQCTAVGPGGETQAIALPFGRGAVGDAVQQLVLTDAQGRQTTITLDPPRSVSMELSSLFNSSARDSAFA